MSARTCHLTLHIRTNTYSYASKQTTQKCWHACIKNMLVTYAHHVYSHTRAHTHHTRSKLASKPHPQKNTRVAHTHTYDTHISLTLALTLTQACRITYTLTHTIRTNTHAFFSRSSTRTKYQHDTTPMTSAYVTTCCSSVGVLLHSPMSAV